MSDETTLLPCPFCGGEARLVNDYSSEKGMSYQIWHECTGHEGRSGGYGQGVKPFFETPWYATDAEAIAAWNTRTYGTLTAELVERIVDRNCEWYEGGDIDAQAIVDELNAVLGNGTCENVSTVPLKFKCSECGDTWSRPHGYEFAFCPSCGARIRKAVER